MTTHKTRRDFYISEEGIKVAEELRLMVTDEAFMTGSSFSANTEKYGDNLIPFVDKHMAYLRDHPTINSRQYLSNLRLKTRLQRVQS